MSLLSTFYSTIIDALFPLSTIEQELLSYTPAQALEHLPKAPTTPLADTKAVFAYKDERVSKMIWNIKYKKSKHDVSLSGYALYQALKSDLAQSHLSPLPLIVMALPITKRRRRERGYNQCELLTNELIRLTADDQHTNESRPFKVHNDILIRTQHTSHHKHKNRADRLESAKGIFAIDQDALAVAMKNDPEFQTRLIIIIDDVITTGSTMKEASETLKEAGFMNVRGHAVAH